MFAASVLIAMVKCFFLVYHLTCRKKEQKKQKEPFFSNRELFLNIDNPYFEGMFNRIYPPELQLNKANTSDTEAPFLGLHLSISNGFVSCNVPNVNDDFCHEHPDSFVSLSFRGSINHVSQHEN